MRMGNVTITRGYIVDLDNESMVEDAISAMHDDISHAVIRGGITEMIEAVPVDGYTESDIPEFLITNQEAYANEDV